MKARRARAEPRPLTQRADQPGAPELPSWKAFLVQLTRETDPKLETFSGRLEHLSTGKRVRFATHEDFLSALRQLIDGTKPR